MNRAGVFDIANDLRDAHAFVVMAYGDSPFLDDCLRSLRAQTEPADIVVTTSTPSPFIEAAASRFEVPVIVNPCAGGGIAADWNFALTATEARHVTLAHQDDVYYPAFLKESLRLLAENPEAVLAFTGYREIDDDGVEKTSKISRAKHFLEWLALGDHPSPGRTRLKAFLALGNPLPCSSVTFDRARLGAFAFSSAYQATLDWDAWLRLLDQGHLFVRTPERLIGRRHNALTETSRLIRDRIRHREDLETFRRLWPSPLAEAIAWVYRAGY